MTRSGSDSTHSLMVSFDNPDAQLTNIKLVTVGEDGSEKAVGLKSYAKINGKRIPTKNDTIRSLKPIEGAERLVVELYTREPIARNGELLKSFDLRCGVAN